MSTTQPTTADDIQTVCTELAAMLLRKNASYGDSALNPIRCFSKLPPEETLRIRIDDKLSRLLRGNGDDFGEDVLDDLMGYFVLLKIVHLRRRRNQAIGLGIPPAVLSK